MALTGPTEAGAMEIERKPSPISAMASSGLPAISPHRFSGTSCFLAASTISFERLERRRD